MLAFDRFRGSRAARHRMANLHIPAGINLDRMSKILKCAGSDDVVTLSAQDDNDRITFVFESPSTPPR